MLARLANDLRIVIRQDEGQDLLEYGLLAALIAIAALAGVTQFGQALNNVFWTIIPSIIP